MKAVKFISTTFRVTRLTITAVLLAAALALNIATIAISSVATMVSTAFEVVTGVSSVTTNLRDEIKIKDRRIASLSDEVADLKASRSVIYRGRNATISEAVEETTERIGRRTAAGASRNVGSMFGEALPVIGITVVVAATAWEINDACDTMEDLHQLDVAFNPSNAVPEDHSAVCGLTVPTKAELWLIAKESPRKAWNTATSSTTTTSGSCDRSCPRPPKP